jgi:hypothetical protein
MVRCAKWGFDPGAEIVASTTAAKISLTVTDLH